MSSIQRTLAGLGGLVCSLAMTACANAPITAVGASGAIRPSGTALKETATDTSVADVKAEVQSALALQGQLGSVSPTDLRRMKMIGPGSDALSTGAVSAIRSRDVARIDAMYTGAPAVRLHGALDNAINADSTSGYLVGPGGARNLIFDRVRVNGTEAAVKVTYDGFGSILKKDAAGQWIPVVSPVNRLIAEIELTEKAAGKWIVTALNQDFVAGFGP